MWSLYTGGLYMQVQNMESITLGTCNMWSLLAGVFYIQVFRAGLTTVYIHTHKMLAQCDKQ